MSTLTKKEELKAVLEGRWDFFRTLSEHHMLPNSSFQDSSDRTIYSSGVDFATFNGVFENCLDGFPGDDEIQNALDLFKNKNLPFIWWTTKNLENNGFHYGGVLKGVYVDLSLKIPEAVYPTTLRIKVVEDAKDLEDYSAIVASEFGINSFIQQQTQIIAKAGMLHGEQMHFIAYLENAPVSVITLQTGKLTSGIWSFATLSDFRKRGIGTAITIAALKEAQKRGYPDCMAILMPKGLAWGLFKKLGFKEVCNFPFYIYS